MTDREKYDEAVTHFLYRFTEAAELEDWGRIESLGPEAHDLLRRAPAPRKVINRHNARGKR